MSPPVQAGDRSRWMLLVALVLGAAVYWPGLSGGYLFDDYPNIVDNHNLQISHADLASLTRAALSSPSSEFKRPLASLTFAMNYLAGGLDPFGWKLVNLVLHLLNGMLVFGLARSLLLQTGQGKAAWSSGQQAALIALGWMLLPINLTAVLYVVQRMESLANIFVLLGLLGYVEGRRRMLDGRPGMLLCVASIIVPTAIGSLAKETAVMLPFYACLVEWIVFRFTATPASGRVTSIPAHAGNPPSSGSRPFKAWTTRTDGADREAGSDRRIVALFAIVLLVPLLIGLAWLLPGILRHGAWASRDFTLRTRLLSEARIVVDYIGWTLLPTPGALSFYHDDFLVSTGVFSPWTTLLSIVSLGAMVIGIFAVRRRAPLVALGLGLFLGCHLLTGTILPLELIYEHRNYFASFGLLLALFPLLLASGSAFGGGLSAHLDLDSGLLKFARYLLLAGLVTIWGIQTATTSYAWGNPLRLAENLAARAPDSPRAQYELGRTYIIYSHYDPNSPFTQLAYAPLERAMELPKSSILAEQALIFMNARMKQPIKDAWWDSMIGKLKSRKPGVQDESSLAALTQCARDGECALPPKRMVEAYLAALSHPGPSSRLLASYGDYAWNVLKDRNLAFHMAKEASAASPKEPVYHITVAQEALALGDVAGVEAQIEILKKLNLGGSLDRAIMELDAKLAERR